jgi:hypothetical protein
MADNYIKLRYYMHNGYWKVDVHKARQWHRLFVGNTKDLQRLLNIVKRDECDIEKMLHSYSLNPRNSAYSLLFDGHSWNLCIVTTSFFKQVDLPLLKVQTAKDKDLLRSLLRSSNISVTVK